MQLKNIFRPLRIVVLVGVFTPDLGAAQTKPQPSPKATAEQQERKGTAVLTDPWITMKIHSQFVPEDALEDSDIDVDTTNGVVTLSGTVATATGRARAVAIAKATDGVKSVNDKLTISPALDKTPGAAATGAAKAGSRRVTDGWITSKIYAQFLTEQSLEDSDIDVDVRAGSVTLNGTVVSARARTRAIEISKATDGVKNVKDALKVVKR